MADKSVEVAIKANASGLKAGMTEAAASVEQNSQRMRAALDGASVKRVLLDNTHHLAEAIRSAVRNNLQLRP